MQDLEDDWFEGGCSNLLIQRTEGNGYWLVLVVEIVGEWWFQEVHLGHDSIPVQFDWYDQTHLLEGWHHQLSYYDFDSVPNVRLLFRLAIFGSTFLDYRIIA